MSIALGLALIGAVSRVASSAVSSTVDSWGSCARRWCLLAPVISSLEYSTTLLALRRDGMAGVCGVCGDIAFPGEEEIDVEAPATMGGTLGSWRLEELEDR